MKIRRVSPETEGGAAEGKIRGACSVCKIAHTACDGLRPCKRCVAVGKADHCFDVEPKKRACGPCRAAHTACDSQRPCKRCVAAGRGDLCVDPELRKKGRRPKPGKGEYDTSGAFLVSTGTSAKRQRTEDSAAGSGNGSGSPGQTDASPAALFPSSPPLSPLLPPPFPLPNLHAMGGHPHQHQHSFGAPFGLPNSGGGGSSQGSVRPILANNNNNGSPANGGHRTRPSSPDEQQRRAHGSPLLAPAPLAPMPSGTHNVPMQQRPIFAAASPLMASSPIPVPGANNNGARASQTPPSSASSSPSSSEHGSPRDDQHGQSSNGFLGSSNAGGASLMQLEPLLSMFMKELRELKASNEQVASDFRNTTDELRHEILLLHQNQQKIDRRLDALGNSVMAMTPTPSSAASFPSSPGIQPHEITTYSPSFLFNGCVGSYAGAPYEHPPSEGRFGQLMGQQPSPQFASVFAAPSPVPLAPLPSGDSYFSRTEILSYLPFLSSYGLQSPDAPFVVDNLRKPFFALQIMESMPGEEFTPPIFVFANTAFCSLVRYPLHELLGCPLSKVSFPDEKVKRQLLSSISKSGRSIYLPQRGFQEAPPSSSSEIIRLSPLFLPRNGRITRLSTRVQFFYNEHGRVKWKICCVDGLEESGVIEMPINWLPGLPKWWTTLPLSLSGLQQQQQNGTPVPLATASMSPRILEEVKEEDGDAPGDSSPMEEAFLSSFIAASPPSQSSSSSSSSVASSPPAPPPLGSWVSSGDGDGEY